VKDKYVFKGEDITTDVLFKIEQIASILAEKERVPFDDAYAAFVSSNTYGILQRTDNLYWAESAEFIVDEYYREKSCTAFIPRVFLPNSVSILPNSVRISTNNVRVKGVFYEK
jgi:hypothetical protein